MNPSKKGLRRKEHTGRTGLGTNFRDPLSHSSHLWPRLGWDPPPSHRRNRDGEQWTLCLGMLMEDCLVLILFWKPMFTTAAFLPRDNCITTTFSEALEPFDTKFWCVINIWRHKSKCCFEFICSLNTCSHCTAASVITIKRLCPFAWNPFTMPVM